MKLKVEPGNHISAVCEEAAKLATSSKEEVRFTFNDVAVVVQPGESGPDVKRRWDSDSEHYSTEPCTSNTTRDLEQYVLGLERQNAELEAEHEKLLEHARQVKGSRDVHSVYEALDWLAAALPDGAKGKGKS